VQSLKDALGNAIAPRIAFVVRVHEQDLPFGLRSTSHCGRSPPATQVVGKKGEQSHPRHQAKGQGEHQRCVTSHLAAQTLSLPIAIGPLGLKLERVAIAQREYVDNWNLE
jgi:hypothetical protein